MTQPGAPSPNPTPTPTPTPAPAPRSSPAPAAPTAGRPARRRSRDLRWLCVAILAFAIAAVFGRCVTHEFVGGWDDGPLIVDNPLINPPTTGGLADIWTRPHARMYIPVVYTTWWGLASVAAAPGDAGAASSLNPWPFHAANLLVHFAASVFVFAALRLLLLRRDLPALIGALLFALHPLQVEPVAWATGMKDVLSGTLAMAAIWQYMKYHGATRRPRRRLHYAVATALLVLAMLAKPSAVVVPLVVLAIDRLVLGRRWSSMAKSLSPWFLIAGAFAVVTALAQPTPELAQASLWQRPIVAANAVGFYLVKLVWPAKLGIDYGLKPDVIARGAWIGAALLALVVAAVARQRWLWAGLAIFVAGALPVLGLTSFVFQAVSTVADRYVYLSMLGPALVLAFAAAKWPNLAVRTACFLLIAALAARSFVQAGVWASHDRLMHHALRVNPHSPVAHNHVGHILFVRGDVAGAHDHFVQAMRARPDYLAARDNLASTLMLQGRADEAVALMKQTLSQRRSLPEPIRQPIDQDLSRLAEALTSQDRHPEAAGYLAELATLRPTDERVRRQLEDARSRAATMPATGPAQGAP